MLITLALPAYNEEENIEAVLEDCVKVLAALPHEWEIIVIDNASTDGTKQKVREFSQRYSQVRLILHESNFLYSGSCATALKEARGTYIAIMDSDGQHVASDIAPFIMEMVKGADLVIGWRRYRNDSLARRLYSRIFNLMGKYYLGYPHHDLNCGFRMLSRAFADRIIIKHRINIANPELYTQAVLAGARVHELQVNHFARTKGRSTMNFGKFCQIFIAVNCYFRALSNEVLHPEIAKNGSSAAASSSAPLKAISAASGSDTSREQSKECEELIQTK